MDGRQYEYQCARRLKNKGFSKVEVTKGSGDQGIDIIAYNAGKKYGIQCKYYSSPVGNFAVQEAFTGAKFYNCDVAVVITNNSFTQSAQDLAEKTGVLLWTNNNVPPSSNSFWLTKFLGIFFCIIGILGLITIWGFDNVKFPILQAIELIFIILGGIFSIFEYGNWGASFFSCSSYFLAALMNLIFCASTMTSPGYTFLFFIAITLISFFRMDYLHKATNGYHVWKNSFKQFIDDNFSKTKNDKSSRNIKKEEKYLNKLQKTDLYKKVGTYAIRNNIYNPDYIATILQEDALKVNDCINALIQNDVITIDKFAESKTISAMMTEKEFLQSIK